MTNNWQKKQIKDVCNVVGGSSFPIKYQGIADGNIPFYKVSDMNTSGNFIFMDNSNNFIDSSTLSKLKAKTYPQGTVIFPKVGAALLTNKRRILSRTSVFDNNIMGLIPEKIDSLFLYYWSLTLDFNNFAGNGAVPSINQRFVESISLPVPEVTIQKKIASILCSVDEEIQKTDQIILKTEQLKNGLMNDLLTKGIGHKKYKKTKLGQVPEGWKTTSITESDVEIIDGDRGVNYPKKSEFSDKGFCLFLSTKNFTNDQFDFSETSFISEAKDKKLRKGKLSKYDVVLTTRGTVGSVAFYDNTVPYDHIRINSGMLIFRAKGSILSKFLYYLLKSPLFKRNYTQLASGSAQPQLPIRSLKNLYIPIPPLSEQENIVKILDSMEQKFGNELGKLTELKILKHGLMNDIFSQKVELN